MTDLTHLILFLPGYRGHPTGVRQLLALQSLGGWGIPVRSPPREILPQRGQETPHPLSRWEVQRSSARHKSKQPQKQPRWRQRRGGAQRATSQKGQEDILKTYHTKPIKQSFEAHSSLSKDCYFSQPLTPAQKAGSDQQIYVSVHVQNELQICQERGINGTRIRDSIEKKTQRLWTWKLF